jgi:hypothetical protein
MATDGAFSSGSRDGVLNLGENLSLSKDGRVKTAGDPEQMKRGARPSLRVKVRSKLFGSQPRFVSDDPLDFCMGASHEIDFSPIAG